MAPIKHIRGYFKLTLTATLVGMGITTTSEAIVPLAPEGLQAWPLSEASVELRWEDMATNETAYSIHRREGRTGQWDLIPGELPAESTSFVDSALEPGQLYQYKVAARNQDGEQLSELAQAITDDKPYGMRCLGFQEGIGGYSGTTAIGIGESTPNGNLQDTYVWIDNNGPGDDNQALLRFNEIFGPEANQIPVGANVSRAILRIYLGTRDNGETTKMIEFYQMLTDWNNDTTWGSAELGGNGVQLDDLEARTQFDDSRVFGVPDYYYEIDVTPSLQAWADGQGEFGWAIRTKWSNGYAFYTSHNPVVAQRPELIVCYETDPENSYPGVENTVAPVPDSTGVHDPASLVIDLSDEDGDSLNVTYFGREAPVPDEPDFNVILLPDTQFYSGEKNFGTRHMFFSQTNWIIENREALNIPFVLHMGDIVESGDLIGGSKNLQQWFIAFQAMHALHAPATTGLEEGIPYAVCVGNHDQEPIWRSSGTTTYFNQFFGVDHFSKFSYYGGHYGDNNDNHYYLFKAGGYDFIVISIEYSDPGRDPVDPDLLEWADALLKEYPDHRGIVISHHMVNPGFPAAWSPYGEVLYEVLKDNPNLHLMLGGHITGEGLRVNNHEGNTVYALVQDYQGHTRGGNGFLRIMRFSPRTNEIHLDTYSPFVDAYLDEYGGPLTLPYDLGTEIQPFETIAQFENVADYSAHKASWTGLKADTEYEWYIQVDDGRKSSVGAINSFHTAVRTYSTWIDPYFSAEDPDRGMKEDPDEDGYDNYVEFIFNSNPKVPGKVEMEIQPILISGNHLKIEYDRLRDTGLVWNYEFSIDLINWSEAQTHGVDLQEIIEDQFNGLESVLLKVTLDQQEPLFLRITAVQPD